MSESGKHTIDAKHAPRQCLWCGQWYLPLSGRQQYCHKGHTLAARKERLERELSRKDYEEED